MPTEFDQHHVERSREELLQEVVDLQQQIAELRALQVQQRQLQLNRQRLNLVLQTSDIGIWFCDLPSLNLEWDAKCKEHFGLPAQSSVTVKQFLQRLHPNDRSPVRQAVQRAIQEHSVFDMTCRLTNANAQTRWIRAIGSAFYDETGRPSRFDGITVNATEQKLQEEERDTLLYREQLARETAEATNRVKDEFLGVLSHELRSPLNPILGWSRLLQKRIFDPAIAQRALQTIERNAKLQTQLIEDLLDISRILRGKLTLNICAVNPAEVVEAALKTVHPAAEAKSIKIHTHFEPDLKIAGDPVRLQQIFWNLLSNAIKFTATEGWVEVKLAAMQTAEVDRGQEAEGRGQKGEKWRSAAMASTESGVTEIEQQVEHEPAYPLPSALYSLPSRCVQVTITDTGRGISADFLPYVFDYFRQANASTTRKFGGLGLGLAIARHLVELHGGSIQVSSPGEGQGATFTVFLPLLQDESSKQQTAADDRQINSRGNFSRTALPFTLLNEQSPIALDRDALRGVQVLVVDHQLDTREVVAFTLRQFGAETMAARSPHEALRSIATHPLDILLIDLWIPEIQGYQLMQQIRALPAEQGGNIPAIVLTNYSGEYNQQRTLEAGFQLHLPKSVEPETLVDAILKLINVSRN